MKQKENMSAQALEVGAGVTSEKRRQVITGTIASGLAMAMPSLVLGQANNPIKIGHLTPRTGFLGPMGEYAVMGATLAVEEINAAGGVNGRKFELLSLIHI